MMFCDLTSVRPVYLVTQPIGLPPMRTKGPPAGIPFWLEMDEQGMGYYPTIKIKKPH